MLKHKIDYRQISLMSKHPKLKTLHRPTDLKWNKHNLEKRQKGLR